MPPRIRLDTFSAEELTAALREELKIDREGLDEAMAKQADLFFRVAEAYANAVSQRDEAKENVNNVDAELGLKLRTGKTKEDKITEGAIKDLVQTDPKHKVAFDHYAYLKKKAETLLGLKESFQERGRMLRDLGNLYATGYFSITSSKSGAAVIGKRKLNDARNQT